MRSRLVWALMGAILASGCAGMAGTTGYRCGDGKGFTARFGLGEALVRLDGERRELRLPAVKAVAGDKYSDGKTTLWVRGREAYLERGGQPTHYGCMAER